MLGPLDTGSITVISPHDGSAESLPLADDPHCTSICFGGLNLKKAYVARTHIDRLLEIGWPRAGLRLNYGVYSG